MEAYEVPCTLPYITLLLAESVTLHTTDNNMRRLIVIHVTATPMLNGEICVADFIAKHEEKTTTYKSGFPLAG